MHLTTLWKLSVYLENWLPHLSFKFMSLQHFKRNEYDTNISYKNIFLYFFWEVFDFIYCVCWFLIISLKDTSRVLKIFLVDPKAWVSRVFSCKIVLSRVTFLCAIAYYRCIPIKEDLPSRNVHFFGKDTKKLFIPYHNNLPYIILRGKNGAHVQQDSCILKNDLILNCEVCKH